MLEHIHSFLGYFSKLFVTLDGIGLAPVFIALTANSKQKWRNIMMNKAIVIAFFILLFFAYTGSVVLDLLGISLTALKIAGGILLLIMAIDLVLGNPEPAMNSENKEERKESLKRTDISVFPLAIPLLSGPATITMLTICMKNAQGMPLERSLIIAALAVNLVVCWLILKFSSKVSQLLGKTGVSVINRIVGILLAAMSCEFLMNGFIEILKSAR
ncbi:MAG: NAAT family transporter [Clostridium sp.]|nr:NAAT family transporter [Clostridium sp.]